MVCIGKSSHALELGVESVVPRTVGHQRNCANVEHNSVENYYRRSTALPLLDYLIQQMEKRLKVNKFLCLSY